MYEFFLKAVSYFQAGGPVMYFILADSMLLWFLFFRGVFVLHSCRDLSLEERVRILKRIFKMVHTLSIIAPLLGLLGTVMGMVRAFDSMVFLGLGSTRSFASGISEALITTQGGLTVAIPGIYASHFIKRRSDRMEKALKGFLGEKVD